jgi:hypothetical protein
MGKSLLQIYEFFGAVAAPTSLRPSIKLLVKREIKKPLWTKGPKFT